MYLQSVADRCLHLSPVDNIHFWLQRMTSWAADLLSADEPFCMEFCISSYCYSGGPKYSNVPEGVTDKHHTMSYFVSYMNFLMLHLTGSFNTLFASRDSNTYRLQLNHKKFFYTHASQKWHASFIKHTKNHANDR